MRRYNVTDAPQHKYSKQIKWFVKGVTLWAGWLCKGEGRSQDVKGLLINPCKGHLCAKPKFKTSVGLITDQWSAHVSLFGISKKAVANVFCQCYPSGILIEFCVNKKTAPVLKNLGLSLPNINCLTV